MRPVAELRKEALAAKPPKETGDFRQPDLVELITLDPTIKLDIRYATADNFLSTPDVLAGASVSSTPGSGGAGARQPVAACQGLWPADL